MRVEDGTPWSATSRASTCPRPSRARCSAWSTGSRRPSSCPQGRGRRRPLVLARTVAEAHPVSRSAAPCPTTCGAGRARPDRARGRGGRAAYAFRHEITREVAYELLTESQRRPLHRAVAEWYERNYSEDELAPHHALLAHHWAGPTIPPRRSPTSSARAGRRCAAGRSARRCTSSADALRPRAPRRTRSATRLWEKGGAPPITSWATSTAAASARARGAGSTAVPNGRLRLARSAGRGRRRRPRTCAPGALPRAPQRREGPARRGGRLLQDPRPDRLPQRRAGAELRLLQFAGLNLGEEAGPSPDLARMLSTRRRGSLLGLRGLADRYAARAIAMADAGGQREARAYVWNVRAVIEAQRGPWARAGGQRRGARALRRDRRLQPRGRGLADPLGAPHLLGRVPRRRERWRRHRELAERKRQPAEPVLVAAGRGGDALGRDETDGRGACARGGAGDPDGAERRQQHDREALLDRGRRAAQGRCAEASAPPTRDRDGRPPAADGLPLGRLLRRRGGGLPRALATAAATGRAALRKAQRGCKRRAPRRAPVRHVRPRRWLLQGLLDGSRDRPARCAPGAAPRTSQEMEMRTTSRAPARDRPPRRRRASERDSLPRRRGGHVRAPGRLQTCGASSRRRSTRAPAPSRHRVAAECRSSSASKRRCRTR